MEYRNRDFSFQPEYYYTIYIFPNGPILALFLRKPLKQHHLNRIIVMFRLQIPYDRVLINPIDFDPRNFDSILRKLLAASRKMPVVIEVFNDYTQYLLFVREEQIYWAGIKGPDGFESISIRDYFSRLQRTQFPKVVAYETNLLLYHSLLVYLQNRPELKVSSSLVDLDDLLDRTEMEHRNSLVTAMQPENLIMLRYKDGIPASCNHGMASGSRGARNIREEFLVKIYTMAAHAVFEINLFTDLVVSHAEDAGCVPSDYQGTIPSYFMSQPPKLTVKLKNRPLKTYTFTGNDLTIGRLPDNDIVIDNLSVSRKHAVIHARKSGYYIKDLGSKNHTYLNGQKIDNSELTTGDVITIGKYNISFKIPKMNEGRGEDLDQTIIIPNFHSSRTDNGPPRLFRRSDHEEFVLDCDRITIGRSRDSTIRLNGLFAPRITVEIIRSGDDFMLQKTAGRKDICINGERMAEKVLEEEDLIAVGSEEFVFKR